MVYFRELNYLPSSRFCDFVGSFREKKKKEEIIVFTNNFCRSFMTNYREAKKFSCRIYFWVDSSFSGEHCVHIMCKKWAAKSLDESYLDSLCAAIYIYVRNINSCRVQEL
jgi:hypothetical protein